MYLTVFKGVIISSLLIQHLQERRTIQPILFRFWHVITELKLKSKYKMNNLFHYHSGMVAHNFLDKNVQNFLNQSTNSFHIIDDKITTNSIFKIINFAASWLKSILIEQKYLRSLSECWAYIIFKKYCLNIYVMLLTT